MQFRTMTLVALMAVALATRAADAQTSRPSNAQAAAPAVEVETPASSESTTTIIRRSGESTSSTRPSIGAKATPAGFDTSRVVLSLAIVIALIFALRWLSQRLFGKVVASRSSRAVQVLSRNVISPKQQLLVVQVGRRLVVVGDSGQQMNPLCEITDPDEMAALIGQIREEKRESTPAAFGAMFGRAGSTFEKENVEPQRPVDEAGVDDDSADDSTDGSTGPSSVQDTRDELNGLMDKVRVMSRQFRRT